VEENPVRLFGIKLLGVSYETLHKIVLTLAVTFAIFLLKAIVEWIFRLGTRSRPKVRRSFMLRQTANIAAALLFLVTMMSIWFDDPSRLATGIGLVSAGLAFALQKVVTSLAGYFVIIRSSVFTVGERITMGGVRGDVISLGFLKTTLMEMGDPADTSGNVWVKGRQYTGRIVTITNDKIFEEPIFNATRDFPFLWEEIQIPITYASDRNRAESILLEAAQKATAEIQRRAEPYRKRLNDAYHLELESLAPRVFYRITDNWLELSLRFVVSDRFSRETKDSISRDILLAFDEVKIGIASTTVDIVAMPALQIRTNTPPAT
jgi:small-conductance mechanosensitive channel